MEKPVWRLVRRRGAPVLGPWRSEWEGLDLAACAGCVAQRKERSVWVSGSHRSKVDSDPTHLDEMESGLGEENQILWGPNELVLSGDKCAKRCCHVGGYLNPEITELLRV